MQYETNSKLIKKGDIFVAIKGCHYDGHNFINEAINNGAIKIIGEENFKGNVKYKKVKSSKKYLTKILGKQNSMLTKKNENNWYNWYKGKNNNINDYLPVTKKFKCASSLYRYFRSFV